MLGKEWVSCNKVRPVPDPASCGDVHWLTRTVSLSGAVIRGVSPGLCQGVLPGGEATARGRDCAGGATAALLRQRPFRANDMKEDKNLETRGGEFVNSPEAL